MLKLRLALILIVGLTGGALWLAGCEKDTPRIQQEGPINANTVIATVDNETITLGEVLRELDQLTIPGSNKAATPENAYNEVLYRKLAFIKAGDFGDFDPKEIHRLARNRLHDVVMQYMFWDRISQHTVVPDSSIDSFYRVNLPSYTTPARRAVTHILMSDNPKAWEATGFDVTGWSTETLKAKEKELIDRYYQEIQNGADIAELAAKYSHDSNSKARRGDSGWFRREDMVEEFSNAAFSLPVGAVSKPFKSIYGWHILRVDSASAEHVVPLDESLRAQIRQQLAMQIDTRIAQHFVDSVFQLASYEWNDDILARDVGDYDQYDWVCIVNGTDTITAGVLREYEMMYRTGRRGVEITPDVRKSLVISKSAPWVLSAVSRQLGYFDTDTIKTAYNNLRRSEIQNRIGRDRIPTNLEWSDAELESYYNKHRKEFNADKPVQIQQVVFADSLKAVAALREVRAGADFKEVAMQYYPGEQDFKEAAFDLGWIGRNDVDSALYDKAWLTQVGQVTGPVRTKWGFHLVKVLDKKMQLEFSAAKNDVRRKLREQAYEEQENKWVSSLKKGRKIVRYDDLWKQIDFANAPRYFQIADSLQQAQPPRGD